MNGGTYLKKLKTISIGSAMADMALLLLVFFMASTTTEPPKGVVVELPKAVAEGAEQDSLYLTIAKDGNLYFDGKRATIKDLQDHLVLRQSEKSMTVAITADKYLPYKKVWRILEVLKRHDFLNIVFMSESRKAEKKDEHRKR